MTVMPLDNFVALVWRQRGAVPVGRSSRQSVCADSVRNNNFWNVIFDVLIQTGTVSVLECSGPTEKLDTCPSNVPA